MNLNIVKKIKPMKIKLSFAEPEFYVNVEKRTVTCVLRYRMRSTSDDGYNKLWSALGYMSDHVLDEDTNALRYGFMATETAVARPEDEFDVEKGKKIARAKAETSAYKYTAKALYRVMGEALKVLTDSSAEFIAKASTVCKHNKEYIETF